MPRCRSMPARIHSHVLQDVLARLDKTYQWTFFRRPLLSERASTGFGALIRRARAGTSLSFIEYGNGARLDDGFLVLSRSGALPFAGPVHWKAGPRPSPSVVRRTVGMLASPARRTHTALAAHKSGNRIDLGIEAFATLSDGYAFTRLVQESRACTEDRATPRESPQEGISTPQGGDAAGQGASDGETPATGLSPQDSARLGPNQ